MPSFAFQVVPSALSEALAELRATSFAVALISDMAEAVSPAYPVWVICKMLKVSISGFYAWRTRPVRTESAAMCQLRLAVRAAHTDVEQSGHESR
ncbi:MAG: hypothetical protein LBB60_03055 [Desulfovibrio sp.]|nr:hypothetical protein [Desulfovibrio sp.]